jgi:hypothetical protein
MGRFNDEQESDYLVWRSNWGFRSLVIETALPARFSYSSAKSISRMVIWSGVAAAMARICFAHFHQSFLVIKARRMLFSWPRLPKERAPLRDWDEWQSPSRAVTFGATTAPLINGRT